MDNIFYVINMIGKGGTKLYLACTECDTIMKWVTDIDQACWFPTQYDAQKFANGYFTYFKSYYITAINCNIEEVA